jgi:hypothetical protein
MLTSVRSDQYTEVTECFETEFTSVQLINHSNDNDDQQSSTSMKWRGLHPELAE